MLADTCIMRFFNSEHRVSHHIPHKKLQIQVTGFLKKNRRLRRPEIFGITSRTGRPGSAIPYEFLPAFVTAALRAPGIKNIDGKRFALYMYAHAE